MLCLRHLIYACMFTVSAVRLPRSLAAATSHTLHAAADLYADYSSLVSHNHTLISVQLLGCSAHSVHCMRSNAARSASLALPLPTFTGSFRTFKPPETHSEPGTDSVLLALRLLLSCVRLGLPLLLIAAAAPAAPYTSVARAASACSGRASARVQPTVALSFDTVLPLVSVSCCCCCCLLR
jgi:hypothetical protein